MFYKIYFYMLSSLKGHRFETQYIYFNYAHEQHDCSELR